MLGGPFQRDFNGSTVYFAADFPNNTYRSWRGEFLTEELWDDTTYPFGIEIEGFRLVHHETIKWFLKSELGYVAIARRVYDSSDKLPMVATHEFVHLLDAKSGKPWMAMDFELEESKVLTERAKSLGVDNRGILFYSYVHSLRERRAFWAALHVLKERKTMTKADAIKLTLESTGVDPEIKDKIFQPLLEQLHDQEEIPTI